MRPIALLMENQKWKISFKIIDSRNFWVVHPIKMIIDSYKGRYTLGDKLQQHATHRSDKSLRVYLRIFVKIVVSALQQNFVAATCCKKSNQTEFVRLVAATKFCCRDKDFHKISAVHTKRFVAAMCRRNMLLQLVAGPVHTE